MTISMSFILLIVLLSFNIRTQVAELTTLFAFGDSLTDPGNNNNLLSLAKANYEPYGVDFQEGPSGRFCNGGTFIDYLGELLGIPLLLPYTSTLANGKNIIKGVNYASAAGGILDETGQFLGQRFSLSEQVKNFKNTLDQLRGQMKDEDFKHYLDGAIVIMILGSNDYVNNYLLPTLYSSSRSFAPRQFARLLITRYEKQISVLHDLGLRKFFLAGIGPLGCIPNQIASEVSSSKKCVASTNQAVKFFNQRLISLVDELNTKYNESSIFAYGNTYTAFSDILRDAKVYGFRVTDTGCCGVGRNRGQLTCLPLSLPCSNRDEFVFWDAFHPTGAVNKLLARRAFFGSTVYCYPVNVQQMALTSKM